MSTVEDTIRFITPLDGWLSSHEGYFLYHAAKKNHNGGIVEIGSWKGKSTICLAAGSKDGEGQTVYAVDPHKGEFSKKNGIGKKAPTFKEFQTNVRNAGLSYLIRPIVATSEKASQKWKKEIGLLFIDGLHDYKHTMQDYSLWSPFIANEGIIAFHDAFCGHDGPERVVARILQKTTDFSDVGVVGSIIYVQKGEKRNVLEAVNLWRHAILIPLALKLNNLQIPQGFKFFLIHRVIKLLLANKYTLALVFPTL